MESKQEEKMGIGRLGATGHYDPRFIKQVVQEIQEGLPQKAALTKYGLRKNTLKGWLYGTSGRYHFERSKAPVVPPATKRSIVRAIRQGRMTVKEAMATCNIKNAGTIRRWIKEENPQNHELAEETHPDMARKNTKKQQQATAAQQETQVLQQALAEEKLKNAALNTLIDIAEEQLKINIRKKSGARQS